MISKEQWAAGVLYCKGLAGLRDAPAPEYLKACYAELKDKFLSPDELQRAARDIAAKEELFGQYPPLRLWLKYCPLTIAKKIKNDAAREKWIAAISDFFSADAFYARDILPAIDAAGGAHGQIALQKVGFPLMQMREMAAASDMIKADLLKKCLTAWDSQEMTAEENLKRLGCDIKMIK